MIHIIAYLAASYFCVIIIMMIIKGCVGRKGYLFRILAVVILFIPLIPYFIVSYRTYKYEDEILPGVYNAANILGLSKTDIIDYKVLSIDSQEARVFLVSRIHKSKYAGDLIWLNKSGVYWVFNGDYDTVWSEAGSADGNVFPPYPDSGDYWKKVSKR